MKYASEISSSTIKYTPRLTKICSGIQKSMHSHTGSKIVKTAYSNFFKTRKEVKMASEYAYFCIQLKFLSSCSQMSLLASFVIGHFSM
jgi:hypothetical protein